MTSKDLIDQIKLLIAEEANIARSEGQPTSRLTALFMKVSKLEKEIYVQRQSCKDKKET